MPVDPTMVAINAFGGLVGGVGLSMVGHPFDTLKLKLQTGQFKNMLDALRHILKTSGPLGLYAGVESPLCLQMVFRAWLFASFQLSQDIVGSDQLILAGAMTGFSGALVESPMLLLMNQAQAHSTTVFARARVLYAASGLAAVRQGMIATMIRNVPSNAIYLPMFTSMQRDSGYTTFAAGAVSGVCYWAFTFPLDTVRGCMHADHPDPAQRRFASWRNCLSTLLREGGVRRLYKGYLPCLLRAIPANTTFFLMASSAKTWASARLGV